MANSLTTFPNPHDPAETLDYAIDWTSLLQAGETIATSVVTVDSGLTIESQSNTNQVSTVWLSGGTQFANANVTCVITTNQARTMKQTVILEIRPQ